MDDVEKYRRIIKDILSNYVKLPYYYYEENIESKLIISEDQNDYLVIIFDKYNIEVYECIIHLEIQDDKIRIRRDCTDYNIREALWATGIHQNKLIYSNSQIWQSSINFGVSLKNVYELNRSIFTTESNLRMPIIKPDATSAELIKLAKVRVTSAFSRRNGGPKCATQVRASPPRLL